MLINNDPFNPLSSTLTADVMYMRYHLLFEHEQVAKELGLSEQDARNIAIQGLKRTRQLVFDK